MNTLRPLLFLITFISTPIFAAVDPFIGEIAWVAFNYAPNGWAFCDGQLLLINQNPALYSLLGTTYGGNGVTTFALPDLRGRSPIGMGAGTGLTNRTLGSYGGSQGNELITTYLRDYGTTQRDGRVNPPTDTTRDLVSVLLTNTSSTDNNMQPFLTLNCIIALTGTYPPAP